MIKHFISDMAYKLSMFLKTPLPFLEWAIKLDLANYVFYLSRFKKKADEKTEDKIAKTAFLAMMYASDVLKGRFKKAEPFLKKERPGTWKAYKYANNMPLDLDDFLNSHINDILINDKHISIKNPPRIYKTKKYKISIEGLPLSLTVEGSKLDKLKAYIKAVKNADINSMILEEAKKMFKKDFESSEITFNGNPFDLDEFYAVPLIADSSIKIGEESINILIFSLILDRVILKILHDLD